MSAQHTYFLDFLVILYYFSNLDFNFFGMISTIMFYLKKAVFLLYPHFQPGKDLYKKNGIKLHSHFHQTNHFNLSKNDDAK